MYFEGTHSKMRTCIYEKQSTLHTPALHCQMNFSAQNLDRYKHHTNHAQVHTHSAQHASVNERKESVITRLELENFLTDLGCLEAKQRQRKNFLEAI